MFVTLLWARKPDVSLQNKCSSIVNVPFVIMELLAAFSKKAYKSVAGKVLRTSAQITF